MVSRLSRSSRAVSVGTASSPRVYGSQMVRVLTTAGSSPTHSAAASTLNEQGTIDNRVKRLRLLSAAECRWWHQRDIRRPALARGEPLSQVQPRRDKRLCQGDEVGRRQVLPRMSDFGDGGT
jgi:hypothetical protein